MGHLLLAGIGAAAAAYQLWRVPRLWTFVLLFIVLMPKVTVLAVPGSPTPLRVDDLVIGGVLAWWGSRELFTTRFANIPPAPTTFFLVVYWSAAFVCTLLGIAALTTPPLTGVLHFGRLIEYGLLYYFFYRSISTSEIALEDVVRVLRTALLIVCVIWAVQHWTHTNAPTAYGNWDTLYPTFSATYDLGGFLMLAIVVLYALWSTGADRSLWTTIALVSGLLVLVNSDSRAALVGCVLAFLFDIVVRARWRAAIALAALGAVAPWVIRSRKMMTVVTALAAFVSSFDFDVVRRAFETDPSLALRMRNWRLAIDSWLARPFFGDGLGGFLRYTRQYDMPGSTDGWYIRVLADTGVVGLVAFLLLVAALLWTLLGAARRETEPRRRAIVYGAALGVVATSLSAALLDAFVAYKIMGVFWMIVGVGTRVAADAAPFAPRVQALEPVQHPA